MFLACGIAPQRFKKKDNDLVKQDQFKTGFKVAVRVGLQPWVLL